jgi:hypothetical protein
MSTNKTEVKVNRFKESSGSHIREHDLLQVLIHLQVIPEEDQTANKVKKIQCSFTNLHSGEKRSYEVQMPIVTELNNKEKAPRLFDTIHVMMLEVQNPRRLPEYVLPSGQAPSQSVHG